ncbi:MAG: SDR family oxidoreductase [Myxococcales bacterium]|nr:SDR family oxidoreductase [Myxococcales bacterium]
MNKLKGKSVLITGAANGIGLRLAENFAKAGSRLILTDINESALAEAKRKMEGFGAAVETFVVNVADQAQVEAMAAAVLERFGHLDILVNNAGVGYMGEIAETPIAKWKLLVDIDLFGPLYHIYAFLPSMIARREGQIVNISSGQMFFQMPTWGPYAAVKAALGVGSEILHWELRKHNIKVTTVYPYLVNTGFYDEAKTVAETFGEKISMKLLPYYSDTPEKVGKVIFNAIKKGSRVEMVNVVNYMGKMARAIGPVGDSMSFFTELFLGKHAAGGKTDRTATEK